MKTFYRLDHYCNNFGTFAGIYEDITDIPYNLVPITGTDTSIYHTEMTVFTAPDHLSDWDAWENGDIICTHYFEGV